MGFHAQVIFRVDSLGPVPFVVYDFVQRIVVGKDYVLEEQQRLLGESLDQVTPHVFLLILVLLVEQPRTLYEFVKTIVFALSELLVLLLYLLHVIV